VHIVDEKGFLQILDPSLVSSSTKEFWVASKLSTLCLSDDQDHFLHGEWECDHAQQDQEGEEEKEDEEEEEEEEKEDEDGEKEGKEDEDKKKIFVVGSL
jgi:hypothetical protein